MMLIIIVYRRMDAAEPLNFAPTRAVSKTEDPGTYR